MADEIGKSISIKDLYPDLSLENQEEAEKNLRQYFELILDDFVELEREGRLDEALERIKNDRLRLDWEKRSKP